MSKRKRATTGKTTASSTPGPAGDESTDDAAAKDDMVHVTPDLLSGGTDIWSADKGVEASSTEETSPAPPAAPAEPPGATPEPAAPEPTVEIEPTEAVTIAETPAAPPPPYVTAVPYPAKPRRGGSSGSPGIVSVVVRVFGFLVVIS